MSEKSTQTLTEIPAPVRDLLKKGSLAWREQRYTAAKKHLADAMTLAQDLNSVYGILGAKHLLGNIAFNECEDEKSQLLHREVMAESRAINYTAGIASSLSNLAFIDIVQESYDEARLKYEESIRLYETCGAIAEADTVRQLKEAYVVQRHPLDIHRTCKG